LDANQFIPMPPELNIDAGSLDYAYELWFGKWPQGIGWLSEDREKAKRQFSRKFKGARKIAEQQKYNLEHHGSMNWYQWQTKHWDVKWGFCRAHRTIEPNRLIYEFDTAWGPSYTLMEKMSEMFPTLTFRLDHGGSEMGYQGTTVFSAGKVISEESQEIVLDDEMYNEGEEPQLEHEVVEMKTRYQNIQEMQ